MGIAKRGIVNAFRGKVRSIATVAILAITVGLALSMLLANRAVRDRVDGLRDSMNRSVTINPAGTRGLQGGGETLDTADVDTVGEVDHVASVSTVLTSQLSTEGTDSSSIPPQIAGSAGETSLESPLQLFIATGPPTGESRSGPVTVNGVSANENAQGEEYNVIDGRALDDEDTYSALLGTDLADKNDVGVGDTFTAYDTTFTVVGLFDSGTAFDNTGMAIPIDTLRDLSGSDGASTAVAHVDDIENLEPTATAIKNALGDDVDVTLPDQDTQTAIDGLASVERISLIAFLAALACSVAVVVLTMLMIVRERRREIGVLKAIGGSNRGVITQFVTEAVVLVVIGSALGLGLALAASDSTTGALVSSNVSDDGGSGQADEAGGARILGGGGPPPGGPGVMRSGPGGPDESESASDIVGTITTSIGLDTLGFGLLGAVGIAIAGSAVPAWLIARIRPAEILRGE